MTPRERKWIHWKNTHVLLELWEDHFIPEWRVVGYVIKRKVYPMHETNWYAWWTEDADELVVARLKLRDARWQLEMELDKRRGYPVRATARA